MRSVLNSAFSVPTSSLIFMKPLSIIAFLFAAFLIFLGIFSRQSSGGLSYAVLIAGILILIFLAVIWILYLKKEKAERLDWEDLDDSE